MTAPADDSLPSVEPGQPSVTDDVATTIPGTPPIDDTIQGSWTLVGMTVDGEPTDMLDAWPVTMTIDGDQISGTAACNSYGGTVQIDGTGRGRFVTSELFSTEMGCEQVAMDMEQRFLASLQSIDSYELTDGLYLGKVGVGTSLEFQRNAPVPDAELTGTTWVLDTLISGDAASNSPDMELASLEFGDDGTVAGSTGCRRLEGAWRSIGADIQIVDVAAIDDPTAGVCAPASEALDGQIMSVLSSATLVVIDGQRLAVSGADGVGLSFRARDFDSVGATAPVPTPPDQGAAASTLELRPVIECAVDVVAIGSANPGEIVVQYLPTGMWCRLGSAAEGAPFFAPTATVERQLQTDQWVVTVDLVDSSRDVWNALTSECFQRTPACPSQQLAIVVDGVLVTAPSVQTPTFPDTIQISGTFTEGEARELAASINLASS